MMSLRDQMVGLRIVYNNYICLDNASLAWVVFVCLCQVICDEIHRMVDKVLISQMESLKRLRYARD